LIDKKEVREILKSRKKPREKKESKDPLLQPTPWRNIYGDPEEYEGIVYLITNLTNGRMYVGKKYLWSHTRVKVAGRKNRRRKKSVSNWTHYKSSCDELKADIRKLGLDKFKFEILWMCKTRRGTTYREVEEQIKRDVLFLKTVDGEWLYYNANVMMRFFRDSFKPEEEAEEEEDAVLE